MRFLCVGIKDFRNLKTDVIETDFDQVVLHGRNGQGKTSFLEALYTLCYGASFRTENPKDMVSHGKEGFQLWSLIQDSAGFQRKIQLSVVGSKRSLSIDSRPVYDRKDLIFLLPCIIFSYDDIMIIRGEPDQRRDFFDRMLLTLDMEYLDDLRVYKKTLKQRNALLKQENPDMDLFVVYDMKLAQSGSRLMKSRAAAIEAFSKGFSELYGTISDDMRKIEIIYRPSWNCLDESGIRNVLESNLQRDLYLSTTTTGIHRDRIIINDQNGLFINTASTGQMRLASLCLRSAQAQYFKTKTGLDPVMLLDDVLLELDSGKRALFLDKLNLKGQAFYTFLPEEKYFSGKKEGRCYYEVEDGSLKRMENGSQV